MSGASGMLGSAVGAAVRRRGMRVLRLVRRQAQGPDELQWNPAAGQIGDAGQLEGISAAVHLSGANVASRRWTAAYKREMVESRVGTTRVLSEALARLKTPPQTLVTASAVGFYGDRGDEILDEDSQAGHGFFPELCSAWEAATRPAEDAGIRVVHLRFGMVIGPDSGAMARLAPLFRLGLGGQLGDGRQWMSWVSETDAVSAVLFALEISGISDAGERQLSGPVNVVAPEPITNSLFTQDFAHAVHRPAVLPAPAFALRLAFGEMADAALLASTRAVPKRLLDAGFVFAHPTLSEALAAALAS
ncbi:TIGR01777 family oxidoreductase [Acidicapsa acidisoli]|uniref:TIGR01777 family oxidoreductase n=1 Tax=Acidicapsa acidisoli TaxID=1615681 RepID=UPI0021E082FA|nr:TIGR01777 family oxidoreductase [Acidicapsa acidisoli]